MNVIVDLNLELLCCNADFDALSYEICPVFLASVCSLS